MIDLGIGFPMLLLLGFVPKGLGNAWISLGALLVMFVLINVTLFRSQIFRKREAEQG